MGLEYGRTGGESWYELQKPSISNDRAERESARFCTVEMAHVLKIVKLVEICPLLMEYEKIAWRPRGTYVYLTSSLLVLSMTV